MKTITYETRTIKWRGEELEIAKTSFWDLISNEDCLPKHEACAEIDNSIYYYLADENWHYSDQQVLKEMLASGAIQ